MILGALIGLLIAALLVILFNPQEPNIDTNTANLRSIIRIICTVIIFTDCGAIVGYLLS